MNTSWSSISVVNEVIFAHLPYSAIMILMDFHGFHKQLSERSTLFFLDFET